MPIPYTLHTQILLHATRRRLPFAAKHPLHVSPSPPSPPSLGLSQTQSQKIGAMIGAKASSSGAAPTTRQGVEQIKRTQPAKVWQQEQEALLEAQL